MTEASRKPRPGLGRGLSALLGDNVPETPVNGTPEASSGVRMLPVSSLVPHPDQPRRHFDEDALEELAQSLRQRGLIQPIVVRPHGTKFQVVAGERRWRAAQRARLHEVPALVRDFNDVETLEVALVENIQRQDLNAIEEAAAYQRLIDDFGHKQDALAKIVGKSRSHVANLLRLLDLPEPVRAAVADGRLSMGHARALVSAPDAEQLALDVIARGLSVRETEALARGGKAPRRREAPIEYKGSSADVDMLQRQLADQLGLKVSISHGPKGGTVTVAYATLDQLDLICQRLSGEPL
jgi:ParB family transcriptional regulator, chromosome partitioning protein